MPPKILCLALVSILRCHEKIFVVEKHARRTTHKTIRLHYIPLAMSAEKRAASDAFGSSQMVVKRPHLGNERAVSVASSSAANGALITSVPRTSGLQAPVVELTGHSGEVFVARFNPEGNYIASGSMDRSISKYSASAGGPDSLTDA
jgi:WD40 repeat protein